MILLQSFEQKYDFDCGPACAKMVLNYYGKTAKYEDIVKGCGCNHKDKDGATGEDIASYLSKQGVPHKFNIYCDLDELIDFVMLGYPIIVPYFSKYPGSHYSIVCGVGPQRIILQDPAIGRKTYMPLSDFEEVWFTVDARVEKDYAQKHIHDVLNLRGMIHPLL